MNTFASDYGHVTLSRYPTRKDDQLQASDAADAYLLSELHAIGLPDDATVLVVNDSFGALATALARHVQVTSLSDSYLSRLALQQNLTANSLDVESVRFVADPADLSAGNFDAVLIRVPKTLSLLEGQLIGLRTHVSAKSYVAAGAMIKHLPRAAGDLLGKYIGEVQASLAVRKARLLRAAPSDGLEPLAPLPPTTYTLDDPPIELSNQAGIFARDHLDLGTRALLPHLPTELGDARVADLGCGNGVLAIVNALANPNARYTLIDESYAALASAQLNWDRYLPGREVAIREGDGLSDEPANLFDVVLCNPPFHQEHVVGDALAWRMFAQSHKALRVGGHLYIVANRHLAYHPKLKRIFRTVQQLGATDKFVILRARR